MALLLVGAAVAVYLPALRGAFVFDDIAAVTNPYVQSTDGLWNIWAHPLLNPFEGHYWPVTYSVFWCEYRLWGSWPPGFHAVNILLHAANVLLLWRILRDLGIRGAAWAAAIFALHPIHVESVAWIIELKDVLSGFFYGVAFLAYLRFAKNGARAPYALSLIAFVLGILSKSIAVTLPAGLLLTMLWLDLRDSKPGEPKLTPSLRRHLPRLAPFFAVGFLIVLVDMSMAGKRELISAAVRDQSLITRLLVASRSLWFYTGKIFWPSNLIAIYPRWQIDPRSLAAWAPVAATLLAGLALWLGYRRRHFGLVIGFLFFVATISPTLGLIPFAYQEIAFVADRFAYLASAGLMIPVAAGAAALELRLAEKHRRKFKAALAALLLALGLCAAWRASIYRSADAFWSDTLRRNPGSWIAQHNMGIMLETQDRIEEAVPRMREAVRLSPRAEYWHDLGRVLSKHGEPQPAIKAYREAIRLNPKAAGSYFYLGSLLDDTGQLDEALKSYQAAVELQPEMARAQNSLGTALARKGRFDEAIARFEAALVLQPDYPEATENLKIAKADRAKFTSGGTKPALK